MGSHTAPQTLAYFDLLADCVEFGRWVYNDVSLATGAEWLQFTGEDVSANGLRERFQRQEWLVRLP